MPPPKESPDSLTHANPFAALTDRLCPRPADPTRPHPPGGRPGHRHPRAWNPARAERAARSRSPSKAATPGARSRSPSPRGRLSAESFSSDTVDRYRRRHRTRPTTTPMLSFQPPPPPPPTNNQCRIHSAPLLAPLILTQMRRHHPHQPHPLFAPTTLTACPPTPSPSRADAAQLPRAPTLPPSPTHTMFVCYRKPTYYRGMITPSGTPPLLILTSPTAKTPSPPDGSRYHHQSPRPS